MAGGAAAFAGDSLSFRLVALIAVDWRILRAHGGFAMNSAPTSGRKKVFALAGCGLETVSPSMAVVLLLVRFYLSLAD